MNNRKTKTQDPLPDELFIGIFIIITLFISVSLSLLLLKDNPGLLFTFLTGIAFAYFLKQLFFNKKAFFFADFTEFIIFSAIIWLAYYLFRDSFSEIYNTSKYLKRAVVMISRDWNPSISWTHYTASFALGLIPVVLRTGYLVFKGEPFGRTPNELITNFYPEKGKKSSDKIHIGKSENKKNFYLTEDNLLHHTQIVGGTGYGKSNLLETILEDRIRKNKPVIFIDFKGEFEMGDWLLGCLEKHNRAEDFKLLSINNTEISSFYNPFERADALEIVSRIMSCFEWSDSYYESEAEKALFIIADYLKEIQKKHGAIFELESVNKILIDSKHLKELEKKYKIYSHNEDSFREIEAALYEKSTEKDSSLFQKIHPKLSGLSSKILRLHKSKLGQKLKSKGLSNINLREDILENNVVYFQMNSMKDKRSSRIFGKLFLQDLIATVGDAISDPVSRGSLTSTIIMDEFAEFATEDFTGLVNRCRSVGMGLIIAHQSLDDLNEISKEFQSRVFENTHTKIIFGSKNTSQIDQFSSMTGTKTVEKKTRVLEKKMGMDIQGDRGSLREAEMYNIHPNIYKNLQRGEVVCIRSVVDSGYDVVKLSRSNSHDPKISHDLFLNDKFNEFQKQFKFKEIKTPSFQEIKKQDNLEFL